MSQMRHIVEKYHLFLFFVMEDNLFLTGLYLKIIESETREITVKTIININSKMNLY